MDEEKSWKTWKARWKFTEENAINIVKEVFRLRGVQPIHKAYIEKFMAPRADGEDGLKFAIEMGWLKDYLNLSYRVTCSGLLMLAHRLKT